MTHMIFPGGSISYQWWSLETWSRSRDSSRDPFLRVSVSKVSGHETWILQRNGLLKFL